MTASNRTKAASAASTPTDADPGSQVETEAPMAGDTSSPALLDAPASEPQSAPAAAEEPAAAEAEPALTDKQQAFRKGRVPIVLAHPLDGIDNFRRLRLDTDPDQPENGYTVGSTVWLVPDDARAVINAGYAQVDPEDKDAVRAAVRGEQAAPAATA